MLTATVMFVITGYAAAAVPPGTDEEITARLEPFGKVCRAGEDCAGPKEAVAGGGGKSGKEIYDTFCFACHATGVSDAPKLGDVEAWAPRIAKGMDELRATTINGLNIMPPKGTCMACSDEEMDAVVTYMVDNSQ